MVLPGYFRGELEWKYSSGNPGHDEWPPHHEVAMVKGVYSDSLHNYSSGA